MDVISGFLVGFLGSVHCAGMCGPIALALPGGGRVGWELVVGRLVYNAGRVATYAALGVVVGAIGQRIALIGYQQALSVALGILLVLTALMPSLLRRALPEVPGAGRFQQLVKEMLGSLFKNRSTASMFLIGVLNGFLPCGFVVAALAGAATAGSAVGGALFMAGFGAGTIPIMLGLSLAGYRLPAPVRARLVSLLPLFGVLLGLLLIVRGLGLGIPYLSPAAVAPHGGSCH